MTPAVADTILRNLLRADGEPVSGQLLASELGVTRSAVWKGVETLRAQGYAVASVPAKGYRITGTPTGIRSGAISATLRTERLGQTVRHLAVVDSTNREAERWAQEGAPEGALVVADHQTEGRGRLRRTWVDFPGQCLLLSLLLRPVLPTAAAPLLTYAAALALAETLQDWVPADRIAIKWPNDVLVDQRKIAGILLEMRAVGQTVEHVVLGMGVNTDSDPEEFPPEFRQTATSLRAAAASPPTRVELLCTFLGRFESIYDHFLRSGPAQVVAGWNRWFRLAGQSIVVHSPADTVRGKARGLREDGALLVEESDGTLRAVLAGDMEHCTSRLS